MTPPTSEVSNEHLVEIKQLESVRGVCISGHHWQTLLTGAGFHPRFPLHHNLHLDPRSFLDPDSRTGSKNLSLDLANKIS